MLAENITTGLPIYNEGRLWTCYNIQDDNDLPETLVLPSVGVE